MIKVASYCYSINDCSIKISSLSWIIVLDPLVLSSFIIIQGDLSQPDCMSSFERWNAQLSAIFHIIFIRLIHDLTWAVSENCDVFICQWLVFIEA